MMALTNTRAADPAAEHVRRFCRTVVPGARPQVIPIRPGEECEPLNCFGNVQMEVERSGGSVRFGWAIWEWPRVFIEAEHHAVYDPGNGQPWRDVTPSVDRETARLFLPDDRATYDFDNEGMRRDNIRQALSGDPNIREFFAAAERIAEIMNSIPGVGEVQVPASIAKELAALEMDKVQRMFLIGMRHTGRNDLCFCRSGLKFKKCHGQGAPQ
jgi:hypothetical protein